MKRKAFLPLRWLVYLLLLTLLATGVSLSRYKTTVAGTATVRVARPVVVFEGGAVDLSNLRPGDEKDYAFSVKNSDGNGINEVIMDYRLSVAQTGEEPLLPISLSIILPNEQPYTGQWVRLGYSAPISHSYTLRVTWPDEVAARSDDYMAQSRSIKITVDAVQVNTD